MAQFRSLHESELEAWFDHCTYVFAKGEYNERLHQYFQNHFYNDPWRDLEDILVAVEGGEIVSTVRLFTRRMYLFGQEVTLGGIGEVSTKPEHRGKNLSTTLLQMAIRRMEQKQMDLSWLSTGYWDFYRRLGWEQVERTYVIAPLQPADIRSSLSSQDGGISGASFLASALSNSTGQPSNNMEPKLGIRPVDWERDIDELMRLHAEHMSRWNGPIVRDHREYWDKWVRQETKTLYMVEDADHLVGYISCDVSPELLTVREFAVNSDATANEVWTNLLIRLSADHPSFPQTVKLPIEVANEIGIQVEQTETEPSKMLRLNRPIYEISTTKQLIQQLSQTSYVFCDIDDF